MYPHLTYDKALEFLRNFYERSKVLKKLFIKTERNLSKLT